MMFASGCFRSNIFSVLLPFLMCFLSYQEGGENGRIPLYSFDVVPFILLSLICSLSCFARIISMSVMKLSLRFVLDIFLPVNVVIICAHVLLISSIISVVSPMSSLLEILEISVQRKYFIFG